MLVGTQMIAKGHHFPEVTLVGVVDADVTLHFPDFRAEERTFAMLVQVGGRSGRGPRPGRAIVQTLSPGARPIARAAAGQQERFYSEEVAQRAAFGYPPATALVGLELSSTASREGREGRRVRRRAYGGAPRGPGGGPRARPPLSRAGAPRGSRPDKNC